MNDFPEPNADELEIYKLAWKLDETEDEVAQLKAQLQARPRAEQTNALPFDASVQTPPQARQAPPVAQASGQTDTVGNADGAKPWLIADPQDPKPEQAWYTPARYFARQLVIEDSTLLTKRPILTKKVSQSLAAVHIFKRGGKKPHSADTVLKALVNVSLG